jgi:xanthine dehydrogenase accessory factor
MPADTAAIARAVLEALAGGGAVTTATLIRTPDDGAAAVAAKLLVRPDGSTIGALDGGPLDAAVRELALAHFRRHGTRLARLDAAYTEVQRRHEPSSYDVLLEAIEPPEALVIVGAGHIGRALCQLAADTGWTVTVMDDRADYADPARLPGASSVVCDEVGAALDREPIGPHTAIVLVSRGHKQDEIGLRHAVTRPAGFVGMIGSKRRTATVLQHLASEGLPRAALEAVHTPIGLDIGAETPEEIAVSILAEIIMERRGGSGRPMYFRRRERETADAET